MFLDKFRLVHTGHHLRPCNFIRFYHPISNKQVLNKTAYFFTHIYQFHRRKTAVNPQVYHCTQIWTESKVPIPFPVAFFRISSSHCFHWCIWVREYSKNQLTIQNELCGLTARRIITHARLTFAPPRSIVVTLKITCVIARTNMKIRNWCIASRDSNGTFPC